MIRNPNSRSDDSVVNTILKELSSCCEATYAELLSKLKSQSSFKELKELGEQQFFKATESTETKEEESKMIKMHYTKVYHLLDSADNYINTIISEKFKDDFLIMLKEEVLRIILNLYSDQDSSVQDKSTNKQPLQVVGNSKDCSQNMNDSSSKHVIDIPFGKARVSKNIEEVLSMKKENAKKIDDDSSELGNISFDSLSSVHTSDLSSFDDEISISSDEETGIKRKRISIKKVEEEFDELNSKKKKLGNNEKQKKTKELNWQISSDDSFCQQQKSLPQRTRKPNSKYCEFNMSPIKTPNTAKVTHNETLAPFQESDARNSLPRKRGRPRKIT